MPLPTLDDLCELLEGGPGILCIVMPGGVEICSGFVPGDIVDPTEHVKALIDKLNGALAPLQPIFNIIDVAIAIVTCIEAIPDTIGPPPDPAALGSCIQDLLKKLDALLKLVPVLSIPFMIKDFLCHLITFLRGLRARLQALINKLERLIKAETKAGNLPAIGLQDTIDCAKLNLELELALLNEGLEPINRILAIINALLVLAKLPCIPDLGLLGGLDDIFLAPLDAMIELLEHIKSLIQVPGFPSLVAGPACEDFVTPPNP